MAGVLSKATHISERQRKLLELLSRSPGGRAEYSDLTGMLINEGYKVNERTVRNDCVSLCTQERAEKVKGGASISQKGLDFLETLDLPEEKLKEKYLKQMIILKKLYSSAREGPGVALTAQPGNARF